VNLWVRFSHKYRLFLKCSSHAGVIMGAEETLTCASSYLDRETYLNLSERAQSTFVDQRQRIYDLFEAYMAQKRQLGDMDAADRLAM
jgi:hypothetical protein